MDKTLTQKVVIAAATATSIIALGASIALNTEKTIEVCTKDGCSVLVKADYNLLKAELGAKYRDGTPMTIAEWRTLAALLNVEIKGEWLTGGKMQIKDFKWDFPVKAHDLLTK